MSPLNLFKAKHSEVFMNIFIIIPILTSCFQPDLLKILSPFSE